MNFRVRNGDLSRLGVALCLLTNYIWAYNIGGRSPYLYAFIITAILYILEILIFGKFTLDIIEVSVFFLFVYIVCSGGWAISSEYYTKVLRQVLPTLLLFVLVSTRKYNRNTVRKLILVYCFASCLFCISTMRAGNFAERYSRLIYVHNGVEYNTSYFGYFLVPVLVFLIDYTIKKDKLFFKLLSGLGSLTLIVFLLKMGLRTTIAATACTIIAYFLSGIVFEKEKTKNLLFLMLGILILFIAISIILQYLPLDLVNSLVYRSTERSLMQRFELWRLFTDSMGRKSVLELLFGCGFGCTAAKYGKSMHNMWFESIDCLGLVGTFIFLFIYIFLIKKVMKKKDRIGFAILINDFIHGLTLSGQDNRFYWVGVVIMYLYVCSDIVTLTVESREKIC